MRTDRRARFAVLALTLASGLAGCATPDAAPTNTGFVGTWTRGDERTHGTVEIVGADGDYRVRIRSDDTGIDRHLVCDWEGACVERIGRTTTGTYRFHSETMADGERIRLTYEIRDVGASEPAVRVIDELEISPDGLELRVFTSRRNDAVYEGEARPLRRFRKQSDSVVDPPPGTAG